jgi:hypothetical protein
MFFQANVFDAITGAKGHLYVGTGAQIFNADADSGFAAPWFAVAVLGYFVQVAVLGKADTPA